LLNEVEVRRIRARSARRRRKADTTRPLGVPVVLFRDESPEHSARLSVGQVCKGLHPVTHDEVVLPEEADVAASRFHNAGIELAGRLVAVSAEDPHPRAE